MASKGEMLGFLEDLYRDLGELLGYEVPEEEQEDSGEE